MKTLTQHSTTCSRIFKNYDESCPRCLELKNGSKPRDGWQKGYFTKKKENDERRLRAIKTHNCDKSHCGPVCVAFDW